MKTKSFTKIIIIGILLLTSSNLKAETIFFESENIKIEQQNNMIFATKGIAKIPLKNLEIKGEKFIYDRVNSELTVFDNVKYIDKKNDIIIESNKMIYDEINNKILSQSKTFIDVKNKYEIYSSNILFDRNLNEVSSNNFSEIKDKTNNKFVFNKGLLFDTSNEIISSKQILIKDKNLNKYFFENSKLNLKLNEIVGKEIKVDFENSFFGNEKNDPILKGSSIISNKQKTKIYKTVFSTCNKEEKNCRGWELQSEIFTHNKIKQLFEYEKSWLKVFDKKFISHILITLIPP